MNITKANLGLNKIKIYQRGKSLSLRGTFPPKPGHGSKHKQYFIPTGLPATKEGFKLARAKALAIEADLIYERWAWDLADKEIIVADAIAEFEKNYWQIKKKTINRIHNYREDYYKPFVYLPQDEVLSIDLLRRALVSMPPDSRMRLRSAIAYGALARLLKIEGTVSDLKGNYQPTVIREIPSIEEIEQYRNSIKNPAWRWVFGIIAVYGIRNHEVFHTNVTRLSEYPPILEIGDNTKTKSRIVYPIPDDRLVVEWELHEKKMPKIKVEGKSNRELGMKISQGFNERGLPSPYHFRDAYAIRGVVFNFNGANVAKWMGHSLSVHEKKYLRHIQEKHFTQSWIKAASTPQY